MTNNLLEDVVRSVDGPRRFLRRWDRRVPWIAGLAFLLVVASAGVVLLVGRPATPAAPLPARSVSPPQAAPAGGSQVQRDIAALQATPALTPVTSARYPGIDVATKQSADTYARVFTERLLTQDYRLPRLPLLQWVQSEAAPTSEQSVVGLIPAGLRPRMPLWSVQQAAVPSPAGWAALGRQGAYTTVQVQNVTQPEAWVQAVAGGQTTDQAATERQVDVVLTMHTGKTSTALQASVLLQLEAQPRGYGFVAVLSYTAGA